GIGLATCHSIVTRVGGTIGVESKLGAGTAFRIVLPAAPAEIALPRVITGGPFDERRVLLAEDAPVVGELMTHVLRGLGFGVGLGPAGAGALGGSEGERFGVVMAALRLRDGRGEEIVEAARARSSRTAIVVASGEVAVINGVDGVLIKPFSNEELRTGIRRA